MRFLDDRAGRLVLIMTTGWADLCLTVTKDWDRLCRADIISLLYSDLDV